MGLLNSTQGQEIQAQPQETEMETQEASNPMSEEEGSGLTITAEQISAEISKQIDPNQKHALKQAVNAGMKILFSKETHNQLFDSIRPDDEVPLSDELGTGATNLMIMMHQHSKGTMPAEIIIPTGAILLAKACEFINETGLSPVTDEDYSEAFEIFTVNIQDKLDPEFRQKNGLQGKQQAEQPAPQQAAQPQQAPGGLLNAGGQV